MAASPELKQQEAVSQAQQLWEHFVVVGLPNTGLQTVHGEPGFLGTDQKYKPAFVDSLPHSNFDEACRLPPQLPTCCLPAGIDIVLYQDLHKADLTPHTFACVLTEGDGTKVYASCLTFYDRVPSDLCAKHEDLLGAVALKAMCLLSRSPYLTSSQQVLCELYRCAFQQGSCIPVPDLIHSLLAVPCPAQGGSKLCLRLCSTQRVMCPPLPIGPPPGEVSLQPLLEVMQPDSLVGLFAAVLLEQRVLLRSRHHWLLTVVAEGVVRLLYPLKYQHVYIPVMPCSLTDYLEAPTPFLMGLHSAEPVDQRLLDMLVVADLDSGSLRLGKDDSLMRHCLNHPYMQRLERRVRMLMQPSVTEADVVSSSSEQPEDPWVAAAQALGPSEPWSPTKQALLLRMFMEFFHEVLRDHQLFLSTSGIDAEARASLARRDSRMTSGGGSSSGGSSGGAGPSGRALRGALSLSGTAAPGSSLQAGRSSSLAPGAGAMLQAQCRVGMQALLDHHFNICRHKDPALLQQVMQGLPFLCFVGENSNVQDPAAWLRAGESVLAAWRAAEEGLGALQLAAAAAAAGTTPERHKQQQAALGQLTVRPAGQQHGLSLPDSFTGTVVCIPDQPPSALMPPGGVLHKTFPPLILSEYSERSQGLRRRKTAASRQKRPSVGRRRAISELMGSPLDMRRKSPLPVGTNTDTSPPRLIRGNPLDMPSGGPGSVQPSLTPLAPGLPMPSLAKISNVSNSSTNASLSDEYSAEADLIGRQIGMLVHLMQVAAAAAARGCSATSSSIHEPGLTAAGPAVAVSSSRDGSSGRAVAGGLGRRGSLGGVSAAAVLRRYSSNGSRSNRTRLAADVLEAARQLLSIQTGGNGWFIVSRLKELVANPPAPYTDADASSTAAAGDARPGSTNSRSSTGGAAATAAATAASAVKQGNAAGPSRSKTSSPQGKTMLAKSGKILGVNLSGGSSSSKSSGLAGLKVSHGVESFASAASAMASVISRNTSVTKQKLASTSNTNSPTNTADSSKVSSSAPSSTCGSTATGHGAAGFNHSASCRLEYKERTAACTISEGGTAPTATLGDAVVRPAAADGAAANNSSSSSADSSVKPAPAIGAAVDSADSAAPGSSPASTGSTGSSKADATQQGQQAAPEGVTERPVPPEVFEVLADMVNSIVEVAAAQDDSRVVLTVLELACVITCTAGGRKCYLLSTLASNPAVRTEWFWASTFGFAVSSSYLNAEEFVNIKAVVTRCLQQFAGYLAGVGIPGAAAWVLLMQMGADHLQLAHAEPLEPEAQLAIRRHLTHAQEQYMVQPAATAGGAIAAAGDGASHDAVTSSSSATASADVEASQQCSSIQQQPEQKQEGKMEGQQDQKQAKLPAVPQHVAAGLKACGITLPGLQAQPLICTPADSTTSSSWQVADAPHAATPRGTAGASCRAAVMIPAPGAAEADLRLNGGASRASLCSGSVSAGAMAGDPESPVQRPMSPLSPAATTTPTGTTSPTPTPFAFHSRGGVNSPKAIATRAKEGYGSYAKLLNRQGTNSLGNSPTAAAAVAAVASAALAGMDSGSALGSGGGAAEAEGSSAEAAASPVAPALAVQGGCLVGQGALQWAAVHQKAVVALAASSYTAVSAGLDGYLKVLDLSGGTMRLAASMQIPSLQGASAEALSSPQVLPVLQLWHDGQRAAVGNARHQAVWIVDLTGGRPSLELSGLGSSVSCLFPLYRNRDALLSGLTHGSVGCMRGSMASGSTHLAAAYLWDLRRPKKPASSLNFPVEPPAAASPAAAAAADCAGTAEAASVTSSPLTSRAVAASCAGEVGPAAGVPGILCLSVHEDGALAAGGFKDGRVLTWDMRQPGTPLSECKAHTGPVNHVSFLPSAASAAAGLGRVPLLLTGSEDWTARVWDAETGSCRGACIGHGGAVTAMQTVHSSTATRFVTGASDGSLGVWGLDGEMVSLVQQHDEPVMLLRQGGDTLVSGAADKMCHVWALQHLLPGSNNGSSNGCSSLVQPSKLLASQKKAAAVGAMAFDPVAEMLCAGHKDGVVSVWNCCYSMQCGTIFE